MARLKKAAVVAAAEAHLKRWDLGEAWSAYLALTRPNEATRIGNLVAGCPTQGSPEEKDLLDEYAKEGVPANKQFLPGRRQERLLVEIIHKELITGRRRFGQRRLGYSLSQAQARLLRELLADVASRSEDTAREQRAKPVPHGVGLVLTMRVVRAWVDHEAAAVRAVLEHVQDEWRGTGRVTRLVGELAPGEVVRVRCDVQPHQDNQKFGYLHNVYPATE